MKTLLALTFLLFSAYTFAQDLSDDILSAGENIPQAQIDQMIDAAKGMEIELNNYDIMTFPVEGGAKVISKFGDPRGGGRRHEGIDLGASRGTPILSAWPGVVVYNYYDRLGGWAVKMRHKNGLSTYYAHMNHRSSIKAGTVLATGSYLGPVGNTGDAAGGPTHLHFGVYSGRRALNPALFLRHARVIPCRLELN